MVDILLVRVKWNDPALYRIKFHPVSIPAVEDIPNLLCIANVCQLVSSSSFCSIPLISVPRSLMKILIKIGNKANSWGTPLVACPCLGMKVNHHGWRWIHGFFPAPLSTSGPLPLPMVPGTPILQMKSWLWIIIKKGEIQLKCWCHLWRCCVFYGIFYTVRCNGWYRQLVFSGLHHLFPCDISWWDEYCHEYQEIMN